MRPSRPNLPLALAASMGLATTGCVQYHYHQDAVLPGCGEPAVIRYGDRCEVAPLGEEGDLIVQGPPTVITREVVVEPPIASRIVSASPHSSLRRPLSGGWQRRDPSNIATTRVEGGVDDEPVSR